ncbi:MAG TPA: VWA domain-containing protein, partial [Solirubrobacterales bacterium]
MSGVTPYGPKADPGPPGLAAKLLGLCEELRREGVAVGTSEILDAFAALEQIPWTDAADFREALATTIAKSQDDRRAFELIFDRYFFRAAEAEAVQRGISEGEESAAAGGEGEGGRIDLDDLRERIREAMAVGDEGQLRDLARLAIAAFGRAEGSGVVGVDVQRIRRTLGLSTGQPQQAAEGEDALPPLDRAQLNRFERHLRRELERDLIERTQTLPPSRPLAELDRALPTSPTQDLAAVHRAVSQMKRRLATLGHEQRGRSRSQVVDVRRTMRSSLETGGVPLRLRYRPKRPRRPEIYVLCDVSTSVTSASVFFLSVLHALHDS